MINGVYPSTKKAHSRSMLQILDLYGPIHGPIHHIHGHTHPGTNIPIFYSFTHMFWQFLTYPYSKSRMTDWVGPFSPIQRYPKPEHQHALVPPQLFLPHRRQAHIRRIGPTVPGGTAGRWHLGWGCANCELFGTQKGFELVYCPSKSSIIVSYIHIYIYIYCTYIYDNICP